MPVSGDSDDLVAVRLKLIRDLKAAQLRLGVNYSETNVKEAIADVAGVTVRSVENYLKGRYPLTSSESLEKLDRWARRQFPRAYHPADDPVSLVDLREARTRQMRDRLTEIGDAAPSVIGLDDVGLSVTDAGGAEPADDDAGVGASSGSGGGGSGGGDSSGGDSSGWLPGELGVS